MPTKHQDKLTLKRLKRIKDKYLMILQINKEIEEINENYVLGIRLQVKTRLNVVKAKIAQIEERLARMP